MPDALLVAHLGRVPYERALQIQHELVARRRNDDAPDLLLVVEHDPVYTAGRHANTAEHVLGTTAIPLVATDRGGDVTYHGPGQVVIYPIIRLRETRGVRGYVTALLDAGVRVAASYGITARTDLERAGVWVGGAKLAAVGIRVEAGVTSHGIAFNVDPLLEHFAGIVPCGIAGASVCSLASLGVAASWDEAASRLSDEIAAGLGFDPTVVSPEALGLRHAVMHQPDPLR